MQSYLITIKPCPAWPAGREYVESAPRAELEEDLHRYGAKEYTIKPISYSIMDSTTGETLGQFSDYSKARKALRAMRDAGKSVYVA